MAIVTESAIGIIKKNRKCINLLGYEFNAHTVTVERWIEENEPDGKLTTPTAVKVISKETGLTKSEILTK